MILLSAFWKWSFNLHFPSSDEPFSWENLYFQEYVFDSTSYKANPICQSSVSPAVLQVDVLTLKVLLCREGRKQIVFKRSLLQYLTFDGFVLLYMQKSILYSAFNMPSAQLLTSNITLRYYNCCTHGTTSPVNYGYHLLSHWLTW